MPSLNFRSELTGCIGFPVEENPTVVMMEAAYRDLGLDWRYLTMSVRPEQLGEAVRGLAACNFWGINCTIPHKVAVIEHLHRLTPAAEAIGAVNCVAIRDGELIGDNTDGKGFLKSVAEACPSLGLRTGPGDSPQAKSHPNHTTGPRAVILGAGGAARAIAVELALAGASHLTIANRTPGRGEELARRVSERTGVSAQFALWEGKLSIPPGTHLVVNATSIGLFPEVEAVVPVAEGTLLPGMVVADVIPNPPRTRFLRMAESRGCVVLDGLGMLVNQGVLGIRLWSGRDPRPEVMRQSLETVFGA
jgi:shikimate dehydrogenase